MKFFRQNSSTFLDSSPAVPFPLPPTHTKASNSNIPFSPTLGSSAKFKPKQHLARRPSTPSPPLVSQDVWTLTQQTEGKTRRTRANTNIELLAPIIPVSPILLGPLEPPTPSQNSFRPHTPKYRNYDITSITTLDDKKSPNLSPKSNFTGFQPPPALNLPKRETALLPPIEFIPRGSVTRANSKPKSKSAPSQEITQELQPPPRHYRHHLSPLLQAKVRSQSEVEPSFLSVPLDDLPRNEYDWDAISANIDRINDSMGRWGQIEKDIENLLAGGNGTHSKSDSFSSVLESPRTPVSTSITEPLSTHSDSDTSPRTPSKNLNYSNPVITSHYPDSPTSVYESFDDNTLSPEQINPCQFRQTDMEYSEYSFYDYHKQPSKIVGSIPMVLVQPTQEDYYRNPYRENSNFQASQDSFSRSFSEALSMNDSLSPHQFDSKRKPRKSSLSLKKHSV